MPVALHEILALLDEWYHPSWADDWDRVGLVCGDPAQPVGKVMFAVDPAPAVAAEAAAWGADLLVVHHPLFLKGVHGVAATTPKGRTLHTLLTSGCALFTAHTNADAPPGGVNEALARAVGLAESDVIAPDPGPPRDKLVVFVPRESADAVRSALAAAGAGALGDYDSCSFSTRGEGRFRPLAGASPAIGQVGDLEVVAEERIEVIVPRPARDAVVAAMLAAHPYEEVAFDVVELADVPSLSERGTGRIGALATPVTLREFAAQVTSALPATARGVLASGDPDRVVRRVAVTSGAGDFLLDRVRATDADVYVTSDLRHHPASEFREYDGPALVDVPHWAAEWTWLPVVEQRLRHALEGGGSVTRQIETRVSTTVTDPWTLAVNRDEESQ